MSSLCLFCGGTPPDLYSNNRYAENFNFEKFPTHRLLTITNPWRGSGNLSQTYALVSREDPIPSLPADVKIIRTPVERIVITSTVYLGPIQTLGLHDKLAGVAYANLTNDADVHQRIEDGRITAIQGGAALDIETILKIRPDLILTSTSGDAVFDDHPKLERAGLPVVLTAGWMENHPLARSEWIKVIAAFVNKDAHAESFFEDVAEKYEALTDLTSSVEIKPTVFSNAPYGGVWHLPGGASYNAQAFADAGAHYLWADDETAGGIPLDFEVILFKAANADIWLNPGAHSSLASLGSLDSRFNGFRAFRERNVFNNTVRVNAHGGNDIWERGINSPDEVLADLIKIFHPDLLPDHEFIYYERLK